MEHATKPVNVHAQVTISGKPPPLIRVDVTYHVSASAWSLKFPVQVPRVSRPAAVIVDYRLSPV